MNKNRPFNLPTELPNPPEPPAGHRGVYRGIVAPKPQQGFITYFRNHWQGWIPFGESGPCIEYIPLRPTPEGVAPVPEGWEYAGLGPFDFQASKDVSVLLHEGWDINGWGGALTNFHYALRIGSEPHHRHMDAPEPSFGSTENTHSGVATDGTPTDCDPAKFIEPRMVNGKQRWANQTDSGQNKLAPSPTRSKDRSRSYQGIADAMAAQWG